MHEGNKKIEQRRIKYVEAWDNKINYYMRLKALLQRSDSYADNCSLWSF